MNLDICSSHLPLPFPQGPQCVPLLLLCSQFLLITQLVLPGELLTDLGDLVLPGNHSYSEFIGVGAMSCPKTAFYSNPPHVPALLFLGPLLCSVP